MRTYNVGVAELDFIRDKHGPPVVVPMGGSSAMPTHRTRASRRFDRAVLGGCFAVFVLLVTACSSDGGDDPVAETTESTTPSPILTAPPTKTPEEKAEAEIIDTFETLIANRDEYYSNASDYGGAHGWNVSLVADWPVGAEAEAELANQVGQWRASEVEQVGDSVIAAHVIADIQLELTDSGIHEATSTACLDMSGLSYMTYAGQQAGLPATPPDYQTWKMSWTYQPIAAPDSGIEVPGWYVQSIELSLNEPC